MVERQTLAILFYLRKDKARSITEVPIYMRITVNQKRSEMALQRYIDPKKWNYEGGSAKGIKREIRELNEYLDLQRSKVYQAHRELVEENRQVTALALRNRIQGKGNGRKSLVEAFVYHNKMMEQKIPSEYSPTTLVRFSTTLKHVQEYLKANFKTDDIFLNQLDHKFVTEFDHYLRTVKGCNHNTSIKYIKNLKKVVIMAVKNDWLRKDPFDKFSVKLKPVKRDFLSAEELQRIEELKIDIPRIEQVRDVFVFSCYTGYAYIDASSLTRENIRIGIDGELWIYKDRDKTSTKSNVPLLPKAIEIIENYKDHPATVASGLLLPIISNQKTNSYLKEIAILARIEKNLTFHVARHTFATTVLLTNNIPIESVSEMLGHNQIRTTQIYAKVIDKKVSDDMKKLRQKFLHKKESKDKKGSAQ
jgi:site-specific recombinase XerD